MCRGWRRARGASPWRRRSTSRLIRDPLNEDLAHDPFGSNSVCQGAEYAVPDWTRPDADSRPGAIESVRLRSAALGRDEEVAVYLPAR